MKAKGFSLIEIIIVIAVLFVLGTISISTFFLLQKNVDLNDATQEVISVLKVAQNQTLASHGDSQYGVYFDSAVSPSRYILFKGADFASRDAGSDKIYLLPDTVEFYDINLSGTFETAFSKLIGSASAWGNISLRLKEDTSQTKIIYVANSGTVGLVLPSAPSDNNRVKDSRHAHVNYNRNIDINSENIILTFNETVIQQIPIIENLIGAQFYWSGEVNVAGSDQAIKIHTHRLNSTDAEFSIHRDMRFNNASLKISISGDITGNFAEYSADGQTTSYNSIYVQDMFWQ